LDGQEVCYRPLKKQTTDDLLKVYNGLVSCVRNVTIQETTREVVTTGKCDNSLE
jgi:hypothetical protein